MSFPRLLRGVLWVLLVGFSFVGVFDHSLWGPDDSREAGMIREMYRERFWVATELNHQLIVEKPPLSHWTALALCTAAGGVDEGLVRLPAALFALGTLILVFCLIRGRGADPDAGRERAAWSAVFLCATAVEFAEYARVVLTDMCVTFMVTLSLFLFWRTWLRRAGDSKFPAWRWAPFLIVTAIGFYAKGLVGPGLVWCAVAAFLMSRREWRLLVGLGLAFAPLLGLAVLPWALALHRVGGKATVVSALWDNQFGRFLQFSATNKNLPQDPYFVHKEPVWYYLTELPRYLVPWTLLMIPTGIAWFRKATPFREPQDAFLRAALIGMLALLHLSSAKVATYALPVFPVAFAMTGTWLVEAASRERLTGIEAACGALTAMGAALLLLGAPIAAVVAHVRRPDIVIAATPADVVRLYALATVTVGVASAGIVALWRSRRSVGRRWVWPLAPAFVAWGFTALWSLLLPHVEHHRTYEPIVALAREQLQAGREVALYRGDERWLGAFDFYLDRSIPIVPVGSLAGYLAVPQPRAVIVALEVDPSFERLLAETPHTVLQPEDAGIKGGSFCIVTNPR